MVSRDEPGGLHGIFDLEDGRRLLMEHPFHCGFRGDKTLLKYGLKGIRSYGTSHGSDLARTVKRLARRALERHESVVVASRPPYMLPLRLEDSTAQARIQAPATGIWLRAQILLLPDVLMHEGITSERDALFVVDALFAISPDPDEEYGE